MADQPLSTRVPFGAMGIACNSCGHVFPGNAFCEAFPDGDGIPDPITGGRNNHTTPYPGDHGLRYHYDARSGMPKPKWAP